MNGKKVGKDTIIYRHIREMKNTIVKNSYTLLDLLSLFLAFLLGFLFCMLLFGMFFIAGISTQEWAGGIKTFLAVSATLLLEAVTMIVKKHTSVSQENAELVNRANRPKNELDQSYNTIPSTYLLEKVEEHGIIWQTEKTSSATEKD